MKIHAYAVDDSIAASNITERRETLDQTLRYTHARWLQQIGLQMADQANMNSNSFMDFMWFVNDPWKCHENQLSE